MATLPSVIPRYHGQDTRLIEAAKRGEPSEIRRLLADGIDVNDTDKNGTSPLIMASCAGQLKAVELLLNAGADKTPKDSLGYDAYHAAMFYGDFRGATVEPYDRIMKLIKSKSGNL